MAYDGYDEYLFRVIVAVVGVIVVVEVRVFAVVDGGAGERLEI